MTALKDNLMNTVIRKYGFEHKVTIWFCGLCENNRSMTVIMKAYNKIMK